jgi:glycerate kinase
MPGPSEASSQPEGVVRAAPRLLAAPDAYKGTASAESIATAVAQAASQIGMACDRCPLSDGGEGFLAVLTQALERDADGMPVASLVARGSFERHVTVVRGPLGGSVRAEWLMFERWPSNWPPLASAFRSASANAGGASRASCTSNPAPPIAAPPSGPEARPPAQRRARNSAAAPAEQQNQSATKEEGASASVGALAGARRRPGSRLGGEPDLGMLPPGPVALLEAAQACGLGLVGGAEGNDALGASSAGLGDLLAAAVEQGARSVVVGLGGSATTDGGAGLIDALDQAGLLERVRAEVRVVAAADVEAPFFGALDFASQKGARPQDEAVLAQRLGELAQHYRARFGVDVRRVPGAGAAGGIGGALMALGATVVPGFEFVAGAVSLRDRIRASDVVVSGEGCLDATSWQGKVIGRLAALVLGPRRANSDRSRTLVIVPGSVASGAFGARPRWLRLLGDPGSRGGRVGPGRRVVGASVFEGPGGVLVVVDLSASVGRRQAMEDPVGAVGLALVPVLEELVAW